MTSEEDCGEVDEITGVVCNLKKGHFGLTHRYTEQDFVFSWTNMSVSSLIKKEEPVDVMAMGYAMWNEYYQELLGE